MSGADDLAGTTWVVTALGDDPVPAEGGPAVVSFGSDGRLSGLGGVNRFSGPYALRGDELAAGPLMSTRKGGPPEWMAVEARLMAALDRPLRVARIAGGLLLDGPGGAVALAPVAEPAG